MRLLMMAKATVRGRINRWIVICSLVVASLLPASAGTNRWTTNGPYGGRISAIAYDPSDPTRIYAALQFPTIWGRGMILMSADGGSEWTPISPRTSTIRSLAVDPFDSNRLFAGTDY